MSKNIIIVGGGISGLTLLHHLRVKYRSRPDIVVKLFEKESTTGGTIRTIQQNGFQYETGPNGFLDSKASTIELVKELGLIDELIMASPVTKKRYICAHDQLFSVPKDPLSFSLFPLLEPAQKWRVFKDFFIAKGHDPDETVYEFGSRRFGEGFTNVFVDAMVSGIFGGDIHELNLKSAFPKIYDLEQAHGSIFKGLFKKRRKPGKLCSFKNGMNQLIEAISTKYADSIFCRTVVTSVAPKADGFLLKTGDQDHFADELILCVPAFVAADVIRDFDLTLAARLKNISYAPIVIVGLGYPNEQCTQVPKGFGYLRTSDKNREALGVLFSSQIFPGRSSARKSLFQVMLGGARHHATIAKNEGDLFAAAENEIETVLGVSGKPVDRFLLRWTKAIPQYNRSYPQTMAAIEGKLEEYPHLHLLANYRGGIAVNDCTANAKTLSENIHID